MAKSIVSNVLGIAILSLNLIACQKPVKADAQKIAGVLVANKASSVNGVRFVAPQYVMVSVPATFQLQPPTGLTIASAAWDFGDGSPIQNGPGPLDHKFYNLGPNTVTVTFTDSSGQIETVTETVNVLAYSELLTCVAGLMLSAPDQADKDQALSLGVTIPSCMTGIVTGIQWSFGDGSPDQSGADAQHSYSSAGTYAVTATVALSAPASVPTLVLKSEIVIHDPTVTQPPPPPPNPLACPSAGQTRQVTGSDYTESKKCGTDGTETDTYHDLITQTCQLVGGESLLWVETSRAKQLVSAGQCQGQSCALPGGGSLKDGVSTTFYSSQNPAAACSTVAQTRKCANGTLSGSSNYQYLTCADGCSGFGSNGSVRSGVVVGQISSPHQCSFGETGITDIFTQIADQTCTNGTVTTSNVRQGSLISEGKCPTYSWVPTGEYSQCSADCGGQQNQLFACASSDGAKVSTDHCSGDAPVITRVCDGNPDAANTTSSETTPDGSGSTELCPAHQIGVVVKHRDQTTTTRYACVNHAVQIVDQQVSYSPWETDSYCRDYVGYRCSQDSLSNTKAHGRYNWMLKCADQVPAIKQFLEEFAQVRTSDKNGSGDYGLGDKGRVLYPTFMYQRSGGSSDTPWIAPVDPKAPCDVPSTVYVAAVCLSSCATPEQQILAQANAKGKLGYQPIVETWQKKFEFVATLQSESTLSSRRVQKTKVDQWVTELMDTHHDIIEFRMKSGGVLRVTPNHPLLSIDGRMRSAGEFKEGDSLVQLGGVADPIVSLSHEDYFGKVYNVFVRSADLHKNVVVTNGYLNGTAFYQNEGAKFLNRVVLRDRLVKGVFEK